MTCVIAPRYLLSLGRRGSGGPKLRLRKLKNSRKAVSSPSPGDAFLAQRVFVQKRVGLRVVSSNCKTPSRARTGNRNARETTQEMKRKQQQPEGMSFREWRLASEKARRAAKKTAEATATASPATPMPPAMPSPATLPQCFSWQPLQSIETPSVEPPSAPSSPLHQPDLLYGNVNERVLVTPRGSRAHTIRHRSPCGTIRTEQYISPAGAHLTRAERCAWRHSVAAAREAAAVAREEDTRLTRTGCKRDLWRFLRRLRCGECPTCSELRRFGG